jgi:hypothetical protein
LATLVRTVLFIGVIAFGVNAGPATAAVPSASGGAVNVQLSAKATNGYSASLSSEGDTIHLSFARGLFPSLIYTFHGRVSATRITATIADLGKVDLRFLPGGKTGRARIPRNCNGPTAKFVEGHFVGRFDFRAEMGVATLDLTHAKGSVTSPGWHCASESLKNFFESRPGAFTVTYLQDEEAERKVGLEVFAATDAEHPEPVGAEASAVMVTQRGSVKVDHLAVALRPRIFSYDSALTSATVSPRSPFHGSATYCASCAPGSRWTGDLTVSLPGVGGDVPLTGSAYQVALKRFTTGEG